RTTSGLTDAQITQQFKTVGAAWERHTHKNQDLLSRDTISKKKQALDYWYSYAGERAWIEYSLSNAEFSAYTGNKRLLMHT
ncbi:hypothetical protein EBZ38_15780, partial [bacterium]|nr:hypothetical protein [bacterium]